MKYYRLAKGTEVKYVALPSEFWLPVAEYVCFHPDWLGTLECQEFLFGMIADREDEPDWDLSGLPEVTYDTCVELSQAEYRKLTGGIEKADYYHRNDEPYYEGELPEDWEEKAQLILLPDPYWRDQFGYEGDWYKVVDGQIDNENMFYTMVELMEGVDPELQVEAYDHWIYAHALAAERADTTRIEMSMESPFDWLSKHGCGEWEWISDYCNCQNEYDNLDTLYRVLNGDIPKEGEWCERMTKDEMEHEYERRFPLMLSGVLENIAIDIRKGNLKFRIQFPE